MRALAVLMVAGVHTHPRLVPGGSIGVDAFFVLSGFLITTLLTEELDANGYISKRRFYARRALRLLPALAGLLLVVTLWAVFVAAPSTRHRALLEVLAAASYTRNFTWWSHVPGTLLGHTWSLAVEEQFYLVWPVVVMLVVRPRQRAWISTATFMTIFIVFAAFRQAHVVGPGLLFVQRPEALLLGAALSLVRRDFGDRWTRLLTPPRAAVATAIGACGLIALSFWDGADSFFSIGFAAAAIFSTVLIAGLVELHGCGPARPFCSRLAVAFGRMSYGFYLWHMPVLRWTDDRLIGTAAVVRIPIGLAVALAATVTSYRLLETPALRLKRRFQSTQAVVAHR